MGEIIDAMMMPDITEDMMIDITIEGTMIEIGEKIIMTQEWTEEQISVEGIVVIYHEVNQSILHHKHMTSFR